MRVKFPAALVTVLILALPAFARAQSLGEIAAREREKKKVKPAGKVYTEDDLKGAGAKARYVPPEVSGVAPAPGAEAAAPAEGGAAAGEPAADRPKEKTEDELHAEQEQAWRDKLKKANEDVTRLSAEVTRLQTALNDLSGNLYGASRTSIMNQLDQAKRSLAAAQQSAADLEEEGRRSRFRP